MAGLYEKAKCVSVETYLERCGLSGRERDSGTRFDECPVCQAAAHGIFSVRNGRGHCFLCGFHGSVVDLHAVLNGLDAIAAAKDLADEQPGVPDLRLAKARLVERSVKDEARSLAVAEVSKRFREDLPSTSKADARDYLIGRNIEPRVIDDAAKAGWIRYLPTDPRRAQCLLEDVVGRDLLVESGLLRPEAKAAAAAYRPLVFLMPGGGGLEFRLIRPPRTDDDAKSIRYGQLRYPYFAAGTDAFVMIVEGAIDLLSVRSMKPTATIVGLPGCSAWKPEWFPAIARRVGTNQFVLGLDADSAGDEAANRIGAALADQGLSCIRLRPRIGTDWNDVLSARKTARMAA